MLFSAIDIVDGVAGLRVGAADVDVLEAGVEDRDVAFDGVEDLATGLQEVNVALEEARVGSDLALDDGVVAREGFDFSGKDGRRPVGVDARAAGFRFPDDDDFLFAPKLVHVAVFSQVIAICI